MGKPRLDSNEIRKIRNLRMRGYSLTEIAQQVKCAKSTINRYIADVAPEGEYLILLRKKQNRSARRSEQVWLEERTIAQEYLSSVSERDVLMLIIGLYWGEGTKKELNIINGDPAMIRVFLKGLYILGVDKKDVRMNIRVYGRTNLERCKIFWLKELQLKESNVSGFEILEQNGETRLRNGMCRIRVSKSQRFFKRIMSMIHLLGSEQLALPR